jgi:hypothetical protein
MLWRTVSCRSTEMRHIERAAAEELEWDAIATVCCFSCRPSCNWAFKMSVSHMSTKSSILPPPSSTHTHTHTHTSRPSTGVWHLMYAVLFKPQEYKLTSLRYCWRKTGRRIILQIWKNGFYTGSFFCLSMVVFHFLSDRFVMLALSTWPAYWARQCGETAAGNDKF